MKPHVSDDVHDRARRLIDRERVEGLPRADQRWLAEHLEACEACGGRAAQTESALRALKTLSVPVPGGLASSVQFIVRRRAEELRAQHRRNVALAIGCMLSWVFGVASAPLVWRICAWLGASVLRTRHVAEVRRCADMTESILGRRPPAWAVRGLA